MHFFGKDEGNHLELENLNDFLPYSQSASDVDPAAEIFPSGQLVHSEASAPL